MESGPLFTVVTVTYRSAKWVRQAIDSVLAQTFNNFELLICDDCSPDNTWEIISEYKDTRIRAYRNETNIGEYPNRNKAVSLAHGKYLIFVDGDDILFKHTLETLSWYVNAFPEAGMVWGIRSDVFGFMVFPYLITPEENLKLLYCTTLPISIVGFGEILFKTSVLKASGLNNNFAIGDTYIKKKLALTEKVLYVSRGMMFWRQSSDQASQRAISHYRALIERILIDRELTQSENFKIDESWRRIINRNNLIRDTKSVVRNTILKGRIMDFFWLSKKLNFGISSWKYLFQKGFFTYEPVDDLSNPLMNDYNFK